MSLKLLLTFFVGLLLFANLVLAIPWLPNAFYGYVTVNGQPAQDGTTIVAKINDVTVASTTTSGGKYGNPYFFIEDPNNDRTGKEIKFFINGIEVITSQPIYFCNGCIGIGDSREPFNITATITIGGQQQPGGGGGGGIGGGEPTGNATGTIPQQCQERWLCSEWGECVGGVQTRTCNDANNCGTRNNEPLTAQPCSAEEKEKPISQPTITGMLALLSNPVYALVFALAIIAVVLIIFSIKFFKKKKK